MELRSQVPVMECAPGCHDCCGPVPLALEELARLPKKRKQDLLTCRFLDSKGCTVYDERPMMCRLFGCSAEKMLRCPRGLKAPRLLSLEETHRIMQAYLQLTGPITKAEVT
jgi:hypothetical protein